MSTTQKIYEKQFSRELKFIEQFSDGFALPDASVLDGGLTTQGRVGIGFNTPNAVIHFVAPEARFNEEELAAEQNLQDKARENGGRIQIAELIAHRAKLDSPSAERLQEILATSAEINEAEHEQGAYVTTLESHAKSIADMFNSVAAQYNQAVMGDASKSVLPASIAATDGTAVHVNVESLGKLLQEMPQVGDMLKQAATTYTKDVRVEQAKGQIAEEVDTKVGQTRAINELVANFRNSVGPEAFEAAKQQPGRWAQNATAERTAPPIRDR